MRVCSILFVCILPLFSGFDMQAICSLNVVANANEPTPMIYEVGVAKVDITPEYPIRLSGFGFRRAESEGVIQKIWAKALVIGKQDPLVLITVDSIGIPRHLRNTLADRLAKKMGLKPERLAICATHTHTAPMLAGNLFTLFGVPIPPEHQARIDRYTAELTDKLEQVVLAAQKDIQPSQLFYALGQARFAANRRNKGGPVDHDLPLLVVKSLHGKIRALFVNYACHCTTLSFNRITGDWAGFTAELIEADHADAIALVAIGCGADANPERGVTGDRVDLARGHGGEIASEVQRLLKGFLKPLHGPLSARMDAFPLALDTLPNQAEWETRAKRKDAVGYHAQVQLERLAKGEELKTQIDYSVQSWCFGESLAMVFLPGEVVVDYALRLKKELDPQRVWINAYANDVPCYIASERILKEGGYEGGGAMTYYDLPARLKPGLEETIIATVHKQLDHAYKPSYQPDKLLGSRPLAAWQSMALMQSAYNVELMAAEPLTTSPVAIDWGPDGRLYVAEMVDYPQGMDGRYQPGGRIRLLTSSQGTLNYDRSTVFLDNIPFPTGVTAYHNGILVCAAPDIWYAEDTNGDGKADVVKKLFSGFGTENYQARVNSIAYGLDHWWYGSCGLYGGNIQNAFGQTVALGHRDFRIQPELGLIEPATGRTQQGRCRDDWGSWFGCDNSTLGWHYPLPDHYLKRNSHLLLPNMAVPMVPWTADEHLYPVTANMQLFARSGPSGRPTAACGLDIYRDELFGLPYRGNAFICEPVNLLVHRRTLQSVHSTFKGVRAQEEREQEFLASRDPWFRPVQVKTGPDGAIWIVDMYRFVIEHPIWIPPQDLARVDLRAGSTMGRIYRVYPKGLSPRPLTPLQSSDTAGLVAALASPNGWQRDMASQLLMWKKDPQAVPLLEKMVRHERPETRLHALSLLDGFGVLGLQTVKEALQDQHPGVRRNALRLAEPFLSLPEMVDAVCALAKDANAQVRLQLALSLGFAPPSEAVNQTLAHLLLQYPADEYLRVACFSSLQPANFERVLQLCMVALRDAEHPAHQPLAQPLIQLAVAMDEGQAVPSLLEALLPANGQLLDGKQVTLLLPLLDAMKAKHRSIEQLLNDAQRRSLRQSLAWARKQVLDEQTALPDRLAYVQLLGRCDLRQTEDVEALAQLLSPKYTHTLQAAALASLVQADNDTAASLLTARWQQLTPSLRSQALDALLSRSAWQKQLLASIAKGEIAAGSIDASHRQRMLQHADTALRAEAAMLFKPSGNRQAVLNDYQDVLQHSGDVQKGQAVFQKHCSQCHQLQGVGHAVGPDLASIGNRTPPYLLAEILDPNRSIDNRFVEYLALTKAGVLYNGLLASESSNSITLRSQLGKEQVLLRSDIDEWKSTGKSLMPEGLEKDINKQDMTDLLAYLAQPNLGRSPEADLNAIAKQLLDDPMPGPQKSALLQKHLHQAPALVVALTKDLSNDSKEEYRRIPWIWRVAIGAARQNQTEVLHQLLLASLPKGNEPLRDWQAVVIGGGIINGISLNGQWPHQRMLELFHTSPPALARYHRALSLAYAMADDANVPTGTRYDALRMIALDPWAKSQKTLTKYLAKGIHDELQMGAISGLSDVDEPAVAGLLLSHISHFTPGNRQLALEAMLRTEGRTTALLDALEQGTVKKEWLNDALRKQLVEQSNPALKARSQKLLP